MSGGAPWAPGSRPLAAAIICPGRGSYGRAELGTIGRARQEGVAQIERRLQEVEAALDRRRTARGLPSVAQLDAAERFRASLHLRADHASALILAGAAADLGWIDRARRVGLIEPVAVAGNSLGFYTALYAAGALDGEAVARLVDTMASIQVERGVVGGQLVYPVCDDETWQRDPRREHAVAQALAAAERAGARAWVSIRLGGHLVLAGDEAGLRVLAERLEPIERKGRRFPLRLAGHSAFHTPLMQPMRERAERELADLPLMAPRLPLVDGRGFVWRPFSADPAALRRYTLGTQVCETFDFSTSVRVVLREYAPELLVVLGPGDTLGGALGQVLVAERWAGIDRRAAFSERQRSEKPLVLSLGRPNDRERLSAAIAAREVAPSGCGDAAG